MRKSLTDIVIIFCVLMLVFIIAVDQTAANSSLLSHEPSVTVAYFSDVVSQVVRTLSVFYYALLASSTDASDQVDSTVSSVSAESKSEDDEIINEDYVYSPNSHQVETTYVDQPYEDLDDFDPLSNFVAAKSLLKIKHEHYYAFSTKKNKARMQKKQKEKTKIKKDRCRRSL